MGIFKKTTLEELKKRRTKAGKQLKELTERQRVRRDIKTIKSTKLRISLKGLPDISKGLSGAKSAFSGFRDFATKVSKTRIAQGELGGTVFKGKRKKGRRISMF